jgi:anti-sigma regulatory factor (Ser/Thr protein kinase)
MRPRLVELVFSLQPGPNAASLARRLVAHVMVILDSPAVEATAALVTSELVTNAVEHSEDDIVVRLRADHAMIRIEVVDSGGGTPELGEPDVDNESGRGLLIVDQMTDGWGWHRLDEGKRVWADLSLELETSPITV